MRVGLLLFGNNADVVPEMNFAFLHVNALAELGEVIVDVLAVKPIRVAAVQIEYELIAIGDRTGMGGGFTHRSDFPKINPELHAE